MQTTGPSPGPNTVTIRRNPPRRARHTPSSIAPVPVPLYSPSLPQNIPSFPIEEILSIQLPPNPSIDLSNSDLLSTTEPPPVTDNLKVFLRIRPLVPNGAQIMKKQSKNAWPQIPTTKNASSAKLKKKAEICIAVNDSHSVTLSPPISLQDVKRARSEIFEGFSDVFSAHSTQDEVFAKMVNPLVEDFLEGKCGMLAALGPSGSGKTHTVFGSLRNPGMIPLALRRIFSRTEGCKSHVSRVFDLSMFEICSERGKAERILDLFQDIGDLCMQQSTIKGLQEVTITNAQHAESLIAGGMLKRSTAKTNSNSQSSRSQCIINIRGCPHKTNEEADLSSNSAVLTIVDLAGAEREKRTGNQGARLLESNFINNTSMVFGLCLRSLLEHQKNPKKPLQKHFQSSLLTRYLRDYLEGKKRMTLILTVKSGVEDYLDTSFLLRQASPYMKIKFNNVDEPLNPLCIKRNFQTFPRMERLKKTKLSSIGLCQTKKGNEAGDENTLLKEEALPQEIKEIKPWNRSAFPASIITLEVNDGTSLEEGSTDLEKERQNMIMQNFAKAIWNVLKQYKGKLEVAESQVQILSKRLSIEKARSSELEIELKDLKSNFLCGKEVSLDEGVESSTNRSVEPEGCQRTDEQKLIAGVSSLKLDKSERIANEEGSDANVNDTGVVSASYIAVEDHEEQVSQFTNLESEDSPRNVNIADDPKDKGADDTQFDRNASVRSECLVSSSNSLVIPEEGVELAQRSDATKSKPDDNSSARALNAEKPKRRLVPASSILLKNISSLEFEDEYEKPKGGRVVEKKLVPDERNRTQGSISLLRLLKTNLHL